MRLNVSGQLRTCIATVLITSLALTGCSDSDDSDGADNTDSGVLTTTGEETASAGLEVSNFVAGSLLSNDIVDCELSDGTETQCYEIVTVGSEKTGDMIGPFCPENFDTTDDEAGVWLDGTTLYEADGDFFENLENIYSADYPPATSWDFADENGDLQVVTTQDGCEAAAQPQVDPEYQSHCVQCALEDQDEDILSLTFLIPVTPIAADVIGDLSAEAGVSLNGFQIAARAPVADILRNFTIATFDDCGGHVNFNDGYHYHAATGREGCNSEDTSAEGDGHTLIGYAMDGYGIYAGLSDTTDEVLDECNGNIDDVRGFHYHASSPELNEHIACFHGKTVETTEAGGGGGDDGPPGAPPQGDVQ